MQIAPGIEEPFYEVADQIAIDLPGATAVFTTRRGGLSQPPYEQLNLGVLTDDEEDSVRSNHRFLETTFGVRLAYGRQVHGIDVREVTAPTDPLNQLLDADALLTTTTGVAPMIFTADCVPVVIAGRGAVVTVHAGWKGLAGGILPSAAGQLLRRRPRNGPIAAAIGPCARSCCYEVGEDLHRTFDSARAGWRNGNNLDLQAIASAQLREAGVTDLHLLELCTICDADRRFYSHRRESGLTGRQGALAWLT